MGFFGKKRQGKDPNLGLPEINSPKRYGDELKFPDFPTYESTSNSESATQDINYGNQGYEQQFKQQNQFRQQKQMNYQEDNPNKIQESVNYIPMRQKSQKMPDASTLDDQTDQMSTIDFNATPVESPFAENQPRYESPQQEQQSQEFQQSYPSQPGYQQEKQIFIKLDNYKDVLSTIENIRKKIKDAESILNEITRIRSDEERAMEQWKNQVDSIKSKLLDIDRKLFE